MNDLNFAYSGRDSIEGWFDLTDALMFIALSRAQDVSGDLLEIGSYLGKSAVLLGFLTSTEERVIAVDLFGEPGENVEQRAEQDRWYENLTRDRFEANYLRFHTTTPVILQGVSSEQLPAVPDRSCRFVHIDGSHEHEAVRADISEAIRVATAQGVIALDDILTMHTPGVTAAAWEAVSDGRLIPLVQTWHKLYATVSRNPLGIDAVRSKLSIVGLSEVEAHAVYGYPVIEVRALDQATPLGRTLLANLIPPAIPKLAQRLRHFVRQDLPR